MFFGFVVCQIPCCFFKQQKRIKEQKIRLSVFDSFAYVWLCFSLLLGCKRAPVVDHLYHVFVFVFLFGIYDICGCISGVSAFIMCLSFLSTASVSICIFVFLCLCLLDASVELTSSSFNLYSLDQHQFVFFNFVCLCLLDASVELTSRCLLATHQQV